MCDFSHCGNRSVGITAQTQWRPKQIFVSATVETVILTACASREASSIYRCVFVARCSNQITLHRPKKPRPSLRKHLWSVLSVSPFFHSSTLSPLSQAHKRHCAFRGSHLYSNSALYVFFSHTNQRHVLCHDIHNLVLPGCAKLSILTIYPSMVHVQTISVWPPYRYLQDIWHLLPLWFPHSWYYSSLSLNKRTSTFESMLPSALLCIIYYYVSLLFLNHTALLMSLSCTPFLSILLVPLSHIK